MKKKVLFIIKLITFMVFLFAVTVFINRTLKDKNNYSKYLRFYEEKEPFDVLFFGSSRMLDGIQPMELWQDYGITSYNMAAHSENLNITYWQMKNAFKYNTPRVAVIDISLSFNEVITDESDPEDKGYLHKSLDHMPLSKIKFDAVKDLTNDYSHYDYYFPIEMYHYRWNDLKASDIILAHSGKKGAESRIDHTLLEKDDKDWSSCPVYDITGGSYADEIISLCNENGVTPVFIIMPSQIIEKEAVCSHEKYFKDNGIAFYNLNRDEDVLNYHTDFADESHLNPGGARKITDLLGRMLTENYSFPEKSEKTILEWDHADYEYIAAAKKGDILNNMDSDPNTFMTLLVNEDDYRIALTVNDRSRLSEGLTEEFLNEIPIADDDYTLDKSIESSFVAVYEKGAEEPFCIKYLE